jgi:5-methylcytosine-specific restriction protein A
MRSKSWNRDELILAMDTYLSIRPTVPGPRLPEIIDLSNRLRRIPLMRGEQRPENYRSPDSVVMKLMNLRAIDPEYPGAGLRAGSKGDKLIWEEFANDREEVKAIAATIRAQLSDLREIGDGLLGDPSEIAEAREGRLLTHVHLRRERSRKLLERKKALAIAEHGLLVCEACGFDYEQVYGVRGKGFIECHHTRPLHTLKPDSLTHVEDLALLCANCHRMVHSAHPWLTMNELIETIRRR